MPVHVDRYVYVFPGVNVSLSATLSQTNLLPQRVVLVCPAYSLLSLSRRYKGTITDETGKIQADGGRVEGGSDGGDNNISAFLNAQKGSMIVSRRREAVPIAAAKDEDDDSVSTSGSSEDEDDAKPAPKGVLTRASSTGMPALDNSAMNFMTPSLARVVAEDLGINRIFCGHQPHGDAPLAFSVTCDSDSSASGKHLHNRHHHHQAAPPKQLQIIVGDTSYSANTQWNLNPTLKVSTCGHLFSVPLSAPLFFSQTQILTPLLLFSLSFFPCTLSLFL